MPDAPNHDVTGLLVAWRKGDQQALDELMPLVHDELRRMARKQMARERPGHMLQATALVNEAYLRMVDLQKVRWKDRAHFFAMAARTMRRILVDAARNRAARRRGGSRAFVTFDEGLPVSTERPEELVALDEALEALAVEHQRKSRVVEMRFFGGLSVDETAVVLNVSEDTVTRDWNFAKAWLMRAMTHQRGGRA